VPLAGALVQLFHEDVEVDHRRTNDDGHFVFEHVPVGEYVLVASHIGFLPQSFVAEVEAGDVVEHVFVLEPEPQEPQGAFGGRVVGLVEEGEPVPIPRALVCLFGPDGEILRRTRTNHHGMFLMRHVPAGEYVAEARAEGWLPAEAAIEILPGELTRHRFELHRP
jgi:hypothetical protein